MESNKRSESPERDVPASLLKKTTSSDAPDIAGSQLASSEATDMERTKGCHSDASIDRGTSITSNSVLPPGRSIDFNALLSRFSKGSGPLVSPTSKRKDHIALGTAKTSPLVLKERTSIPHNHRHGNNISELSADAPAPASSETPRQTESCPIVDKAINDTVAVEQSNATKKSHNPQENITTRSFSSTTSLSPHPVDTERQVPGTPCPSPELEAKCTGVNAIIRKLEEQARKAAEASAKRPVPRTLSKLRDTGETRTNPKPNQAAFRSLEQEVVQKLFTVEDSPTLPPARSSLVLPDMPPPSSEHAAPPSPPPVDVSHTLSAKKEIAVETEFAAKSFISPGGGAGLPYQSNAADKQIFDPSLLKRGSLLEGLGTEPLNNHRSSLIGRGKGVLGLTTEQLEALQRVASYQDMPRDMLGATPSSSKPCDISTFAGGPESVAVAPEAATTLLESPLDLLPQFVANILNPKGPANEELLAFMSGDRQNTQLSRALANKLLVNTRRRTVARSSNIQEDLADLLLWNHQNFSVPQQGTEVPPQPASQAACGRPLDNLPSLSPFNLNSSYNATAGLGASQMSEKRPTHFIAIRVDNENVVRTVYEFQKSILKRFPHLKPCSINPAKLHISVLILSLDDDEVPLALETVRRAIAEFTASQETIRKNGYLALDFSTVGTFGTRVLFATMPDVQQLILQSLHEKLVRRATEAGLRIVGITDDDDPEDLAHLPRPLAARARPRNHDAVALHLSNRPPSVPLLVGPPFDRQHGGVEPANPARPNIAPLHFEDGQHRGGHALQLDRLQHPHRFRNLTPRILSQRFAPSAFNPNGPYDKWNHSGATYDMPIGNYGRSDWLDSVPPAPDNQIMPLKAYAPYADVNSYPPLFDGGPWSSAAGVTAGRAGALRAPNQRNPDAPPAWRPASDLELSSTASCLTERSGIYPKDWAVANSTFVPPFFRADAAAIHGASPPFCGEEGEILTEQTFSLDRPSEQGHHDSTAGWPDSASPQLSQSSERLNESYAVIHQRILRETAALSAGNAGENNLKNNATLTDPSTFKRAAATCANHGRQPVYESGAADMTGFNGNDLLRFNDGLTFGGNSQLSARSSDLDFVSGFGYNAAPHLQHHPFGGQVPNPPFPCDPALEMPFCQHIPPPPPMPYCPMEDHRYRVMDPQKTCGMPSSLLAGARNNPHLSARHHSPSRYRMERLATARVTRGVPHVHRNTVAPATVNCGEGDAALLKKYDKSHLARGASGSGSFLPHMAIMKASQGLRRIKNRKKKKMLKILPEYFHEEAEAKESFGMQKCLGIDFLEMSSQDADGYYHRLKSILFVPEAVESTHESGSLPSKSP